jgi:ABC-type uncharacterized transport system substrate-binding protein
VLLDVRQQYEEAFATVIGEQADTLLLGGSPVSYAEFRRVVKFAADNSLPAIYPYREAVEAGGLMTYGSNTEGRFRQAARLVDRILKGAHPRDVPTEQPTIFELIVKPQDRQRARTNGAKHASCERRRGDRMSAPGKAGAIQPVQVRPK